MMSCEHEKSMFGRNRWVESPTTCRSAHVRVISRQGYQHEISNTDYVQGLQTNTLFFKWIVILHNNFQDIFQFSYL